MYSELFTVTFLHSAYKIGLDNFLSNVISVEPDNNTKQLFADYKMGYSFYNNVLICYLQSSLVAPPASQPKIPSVQIDDDIKMRFLIMNSSDFFNKTYVAAAGNKKIYQFSNKTDNVSGTTIFLSASVEKWSAAKDYDTGTVVQNTGKLYATLKAVLAADHINITNASFWKSLTPFEQVVSNADLQNAASVGIDDKSIDPNRNCFAVIDMYNSGTTSNKYRLFDNKDQLLDPAPSFTIKFKSKF